MELHVSNNCNCLCCIIYSDFITIPEQFDLQPWNGEAGIIIFLIQSFLLFMFGVGLSLVICKPIDDILRSTVLKSYFIQDCGDVIKLYGSVRLIKMDKAYRELLSIRPGYKIAEDAYEKYGCTLAAVPASDEERHAKQEIESLGFEIKTIG